MQLRLLKKTAVLHGLTLRQAEQHWAAAVRQTTDEGKSIHNIHVRRAFYRIVYDYLEQSVSSDSSSEGLLDGNCSATRLLDRTI